MRYRVTAGTAYAALFLCLTSGAVETTWYALADDPEATPFGYQKVTIGESATYRGRGALRNRLVHFASAEALGTKAEIRTTTDYFLTQDGLFLGMYREQQYGEATVVTEAWGEEDGLKMTKRVVGEEAVTEKTIPLPKNVFFATSPSFVYPVMKAEGQATSFALFDFEHMGLIQVNAYPAGARKTTLPSGGFDAERYSVEMVNPAAGILTGRQMLYFDGNGRLVLSETLDDAKRTVAVMYLTDEDVVKRVKARREHASPLPYQGMPLAPLHGYLVLIKLNEDEVGRASFILYDKSDVGSYRIEHWVRFVGPEEERAHTANLYLDNDLTCLRMNVNGKVIDREREKVDVSYTRTMVHGERDITWTAWASNMSKEGEGGRRQGRLETADPVYAMDKHLFPGFALIASQVPLRIGAGYKIPVFLSGFNQAGFCQVRVVRKMETESGALYQLELMGFVGRYIMLVNEKHLLVRLMMPMDAQGERMLIYDLVNPPKPNAAAGGEEREQRQ